MIVTYYDYVDGACTVKDVIELYVDEKYLSLVLVTEKEKIYMDIDQLISARIEEE